MLKVKYNGVEIDDSYPVLGIDVGAADDEHIATHTYLFKDSESDKPMHHPGCGCKIVKIGFWRRTWRKLKSKIRKIRHAGIR